MDGLNQGAAGIKNFDLMPILYVKRLPELKSDFFWQSYAWYYNTCYI